MATFTITGEYLTDQARTILLSGDADAALFGLLQTLPNMSTDQAVSILSGRSRLVGDSTQGVDIEPDSDSNHEEDIASVYAGRIQIHDRHGEKAWYHPAALCTWTSGAICEMSDWLSDVRRGKRAMDKKSMLAAYVRSTDTCLPGEVVAQVVGTFDTLVCASDLTHPTEAINPVIVWKPCGPLPVWRQRKDRKKTDALREMVAIGERLPTRSIHPRDEIYVGMNPNASREGVAREIRERETAPQWEHLRKKILQQVDSGGAGWLTLTGPSGQTLSVPRAPFAHWAIQRASLSTEKLPPWAPITESGARMQFDSSYHTDWILGAGLDVHYDVVAQWAWVNDASYGVMTELQHGHEDFVDDENGISCAILSEGSAIGRVTHPKPGEKVTGKIIVIPDLRTEYLDAALGSLGIITETGGSMAHLVTVLRGHEIPIYRCANAVKSILPGSMISMGGGLIYRRLQVWP